MEINEVKKCSPYLEKLEEKIIEDVDSNNQGQKIKKFTYSYLHSDIESMALYASIVLSIIFCIFIIMKNPNKDYVQINNWSSWALANLFLLVFSFFVWFLLRISRKDMNASAYLIGAVAGAAASLALKHL